jgi:hypothetical protein
MTDLLSARCDHLPSVVTRERILRLISLHTNEIQLKPIISYCIRCRLVLSPINLAALVEPDQAHNDSECFNEFETILT